jgi:hypothetical protein
MYNTEDYIVGLLSILVVGSILIFGLLQPHFEASAYNKATGANMSYFDAVFLDLRVQAPPKQLEGGK